MASEYSFPPVPLAQKPIQHYLKTAAEHDQRDPVISYWCRLYALQSGMKIDRKSKESVALLTALMDWLEKRKHELAGDEAVTSDVVAQAHIENYALKLFLWADTEDRASRFNKNVVKAFYTAGMLFDVLVTFGELTEEIAHHRKYAKWKAAYLHNCLKNGETPMPGPLGEENEDPYLEGATGGTPDVIVGGAGSSGDGTYYSSEFRLPPNTFDSAYSGGSMVPPTGLLPPPGAHAPPSTPADRSSPNSGSNHGESTSSVGEVHLKTEDYHKAQKYCKWAGSALQYEDVGTAIANLQKALQLLTTGKED